ncbi:hypothetical protein KR084_004555 [Drosophila pseudotakahashii]|nr:hypothetical protein KR084_004555 [Drosophila pseudotakahashii]
MGDDANQNHDEMFDLEGIVWHEVVGRVECRAFNNDNVDDGQERRRQVECALNRVMPWNDADFSRINVPDSQPFECHNRADYAGMMAQNFGATARVCIGAATFWCIPSLLTFHCDYFERHIRRTNLFREGADLTAVGFRAAYDWMRLQEPLKYDIEAGKVVDLLHTAIQLEMPSLEGECYRLLCGAHFREEVAFEVYLKALKYPQLEALRKVMLQRIGVHFLAVVGGTHFLQMPLEDVLTMLQQDSLGVNTEMEVMMAIVRWLTDRPEEISKLMPQLIGCVRFTLMPMSVLQKLWSRCFGLSNAADCNRRLSTTFRNDHRMRERVCDAIAVADLRRSFRNRRELLEACRRRDFPVDAPREWIYDEACRYHSPYPRCPYRNIVSCSAILVYASQRDRRTRNLQARWSRRSRLLPATRDLQTIVELPEEDDVEEEEEMSDDSLSDYHSFADTEFSEDEPERTSTSDTQETFDEGEHLLTDDERDEEVRRMADEDEFNLLIAQANEIVAQRVSYSERNRVPGGAEYRLPIEDGDEDPGFEPMFGATYSPYPAYPAYPADLYRYPVPDTSSESDSDFGIRSDHIVIHRLPRTGAPRNPPNRVRFRPVTPSPFESPRQVIPKNSENDSDWGSGNEGEPTYLQQLQKLCKKRHLVLPKEECVQPVEPKEKPFEVPVRPFENYVLETDRLIYEMLKKLDENEVP